MDHNGQMTCCFSPFVRVLLAQSAHKFVNILPTAMHSNISFGNILKALALSRYKEVFANITKFIYRFLPLYPALGLVKRMMLAVKVDSSEHEE